MRTPRLMSSVQNTQALRVINTVCKEARRGNYRGSKRASEQGSTESTSPIRRRRADRSIK